LADKKNLGSHTSQESTIIYIIIKKNNDVHPHNCSNGVLRSLLAKTDIKMFPCVHVTSDHFSSPENIISKNDIELRLLVPHYT